MARSCSTICLPVDQGAYPDIVDDPRRFPWFRDEFVHPREFAGIYRGEPLFNVSGHFAEDEVPFVEFPDFMLMAGGRHRAR